MLTGESRRYNPVTGSFQNPRPKAPFSSEGGFGAWELAARYSHMNLNFQEGLAGTAAVPGSVRGGDQNVLTLGVNWYLNPNFKVMMNYLLIDVDRLNPAGPGNLHAVRPVARHAADRRADRPGPRCDRAANAVLLLGVPPQRKSGVRNGRRDPILTATRGAGRCPAGARSARAGTRG